VHQVISIAIHGETLITDHNTTGLGRHHPVMVSPIEMFIGSLDRFARLWVVGPTSNHAARSETRFAFVGAIRLRTGVSNQRHEQ
jgi:hypothetical protein